MCLSYMRVQGGFLILTLPNVCVWETLNSHFATSRHSSAIIADIYFVNTEGIETVNYDRNKYVNLDA